MYRYVAVTNGKPIDCTDLLRVGEGGIIEQYDIKEKGCVLLMVVWVVFIVAI